MTFKRWFKRTINRLRGVPLVLACLAMGACGRVVCARVPQIDHHPLTR